MFGEKGFYGTPKTEPQLAQQLHAAQEHVGNAREFSLTPRSIGREQILRMPISELRQRFARRYDMYLDLLRHKETDDFVGREEILNNMRKWLTALNSLDQYITAHEGGADVTLRGKQIDVFHKIRDFFEADGDVGFVKLPTGYGKTVLFVELVEALDLKTLIVVPRNLLVDQTGDKIKQFAPDLEVGRIDKVAKEYGRKVTVTTYASLPIQIANGQLRPEEYECLILDESHQAASEARTASIEEFTNAVKLHFSATPRRTEVMTEIYSMPLREAIEEGGLSSVSVVIARTRVKLSSVKLTAEGEYSEKELEQVVNVEGRNKAAAQLYKQAFDGQLGIMYCAGVAHAHAVAAEFNNAGVPAAAISGSTSAYEQAKLFEAFHAGKIKILCNADLLIEGFDEPRASLCMNLRPTRSLVNAEQRGGRVLRLNSDNSNKHATVVEFLDEIDEAVVWPVLFSKILDGAYVGKITSQRQSGRDGDWDDERPPAPIVNVDGIEVIFDTDEVMRIQKIMSEKEEVDNVELIKDLEKLQIAVCAAGVTSKADYKKKRDDHLEWPSNPNLLPGWTNWFDFLGKEKPPEVELIKDLEKLQIAVHAEGVTGVSDYLKKRDDHPEWPSNPNLLPGWTNWFDFLGKEKPPEVELIRDLKKLQLVVRRAGVLSQPDYNKKRADHLEWPFKPHTLLGWTNWFDFLGKKKPPEVESIRDLKKLQLVVRRAGVLSQSDYKKKRDDHLEWPSNPNLLPGWTNWFDFLGKKKPPEVELIKDLEKLQIAVHAEGVTGVSDYLKKRADHPEWPSEPHMLPGWTSWFDFLGKEKK